MIDTHAHLHHRAFEADRDQVIERAFQAGLEFLIEVNLNPPGLSLARKTADRDPRIYTSVGVHPNAAGSFGLADLEALLPALEAEGVCAVGETGLDYFRNIAAPEAQQALFRRQVAWARESGLPLIVHCRESRKDPAAREDLFAILEEEGRGSVRGVIHCFAGDLDAARRAVDLGFRLGVGGAITYNWKRSRKLLGSIAEEFGPEVFLLETDCPFLAPDPHRKERNEPANIPAIARALAECLGMDEDEVERVTDESAIELFGLGGGA